MDRAGRGAGGGGTAPAGGSGGHGQCRAVRGRRRSGGDDLVHGVLRGQDRHAGLGTPAEGVHAGSSDHSVDSCAFGNYFEYPDQGRYSIIF